MEHIKELKENAYFYATHSYTKEGYYIDIEDNIRAMDAYAKLVMAEKIYNTKLMDNNANL